MSKRKKIIQNSEKRGQRDGRRGSKRLKRGVKEMEKRGKRDGKEGSKRWERGVKEMEIFRKIGDENDLNFMGPWR